MAQDRLLFLNGEETEVKITEVSSFEVKYKRMNNLEGPTFSTLKSDLFMIKYANGDKDVITQGQAPSSEPVNSFTGQKEGETENGKEVKNPILHKKFGVTKNEQLRFCKARINSGIALVVIGGGLMFPAGVVNLALYRTSTLPEINLAWGIVGLASGAAMITVGSLRLSKFTQHKQKLLRGLAIAPSMMNIHRYNGSSVSSQAGYGMTFNSKYTTKFQSH